MGFRLYWQPAIVFFALANKVLLLFLLLLTLLANLDFKEAREDW